jgi:GTP cyclohydrolase III
MAKTYEPISTQTLGSNTATVTFSSIPQTYTDLVLVVSGKTTIDGNTKIIFNSDSSSIYSSTNLFADGSTVTSSRTLNGTTLFLGGISTVQGTNIIQIFNYSNTTTFKSVIARTNSDTFVQLRVGLSRSTTAITSITLTTDGTNFLTGTTFTLYGIKAA